MLCLEVSFCERIGLWIDLAGENFQRVGKPVTVARIAVARLLWVLSSWL